MEVSMIQYYVLNSIDFICQFSFKSYRFGPTWVNDDKNYIFLFFFYKFWASKKQPSNHSEHPGNHKLKTALKTLAATYCSMSFAPLVLSWEVFLFFLPHRSLRPQ